MTGEIDLRLLAERYVNDPEFKREVDEALMVKPVTLTPLTQRRSVFIYEAARLQALAVDAPVVPEPWSEREEEFRDQFMRYVDGLCVAETLPTPAEAHNSWWRAYEEMGWTYGPVRDTEKKTHPDMIPFADLEQREQEKDIVFLRLVEIARDHIW